MKPILYMLPESPPVRAVQFTAKELGVELILKRCDLYIGEHDNEEFDKINPARTIPVLDDEGFVIWESAAIMGYLVNKYGKNDTLYPKDHKKRATVDQLLHFSTACYTSFVKLYRAVFRRKSLKSDVPQEDLEKLYDGIKVVENLIGEKKYVTGDEYTIADFSLVAWISTLDTGFPVEADRFPNVYAWWKRLEELPSLECNREGVAAFGDVWSSRQ